MSERPTDEAAFPASLDLYGGLTNREYFAGQIMSALYSIESNELVEHTYMAGNAVRAADALIAELNK